MASLIFDFSTVSNTNEDTIANGEGSPGMVGLTPAISKMIPKLSENEADIAGLMDSLKNWSLLFTLKFLYTDSYQENS